VLGGGVRRSASALLSLFITSRTLRSASDLGGRELLRTYRKEDVMTSKPPTYFLIAYKRDSDDYCRGCHRASYKGDFKTFNFLTREELIPQIAEHLYQNHDLQCNEAGYECIILCDGVMIYDSIDNSGATSDRPDPDWDNLAEDAVVITYDDDANHANSLIAEARAISDQRWKAKLAADKLAEEKKAEQKRREHQEWQRKEYERLKAVFSAEANK
jgi:hypothetical protein